MGHWIVASAIAVCGLLAAHEIVAARVTAQTVHESRRVVPQDYARSQQQVDQIERVACRLLESVRQSPSAPPVQFILAAGVPTINAGATYGKVMVSSGMMGFLRSDDELALILGHELAHITKGHVSRGATNTAPLSIGSSLASAVFPGAGLAAGMLGQLFLNHFNQDQELEADRVGLRYAANAGYDPRAGEAVMRRMAEEVPHSATASFFSSHPSSVERAVALKKVAGQLGALSGVSSRTRASTRFDRDEVACNQARPNFYRALQTVDLTEKVSLYRRGLRQCPESPRAHFELAETYSQMGQNDRAAAELRHVLRYEPENLRAKRRLREVEQRMSRGHD